MKYIKIGIRNNLLYPLMLIIFNSLRRVDSLIISKVLKFKTSLIMTPIMFGGEFFAGLIIYLYELSFLPKRKKSKHMHINLIQAAEVFKYKDSNFKVYLLIFFIAFFDFVEFIISIYYLGKYSDISNTLELRTIGLTTISSALFFTFLLHIHIHRHHIFSLSILFFCLISVLITEYFFQYKYVSNFGVKLSLIFLIHFLNSLVDSIETYLFEYNNLNPFKNLMLQGLIGIILSIIYYIFDDYFKEIKEYYKEYNNNKFTILIAFLFLYFVLCGGRNAYRVATNKIYSSMAKSLTDYFLNPLIISYYYIFENDFYSEEKHNIFYFIINFVFSIIIVFCGCVYNEVLVLYCFNLEYNTHKEISKRAFNIELGRTNLFSGRKTSLDNSLEEEIEENDNYLN